MVCQSSFTAFRAKARVAAFRLRPAGAIPAKTGSWNTGVGLRQPDMVRRELLIATSTFFTCGLLLQTGAQYSAAGNTRACVEIRSVLAEAPQGYRSTPRSPLRSSLSSAATTSKRPLGKLSPLLLTMASSLSPRHRGRHTNPSVT